MITIDENMEAIVKHIGTIKSVKGLKKYFQSLSVEYRENRLLQRHIERRKAYLNEK